MLPGAAVGGGGLATGGLGSSAGLAVSGVRCQTEERRGFGSKPPGILSGADPCSADFGREARPNVDLNFAVDFCKDFPCFSRRKAPRNPPKNSPENFCVDFFLLFL